MVRLYLLFTVVMVAGVIAGVFAGTVVAGNSQPAADTSPPLDLSNIAPSPGEVPQVSSEGASQDMMPLQARSDKPASKVPSQIREEEPVSRVPLDASRRNTGGPFEIPTGSDSNAGPLISRISPSGESARFTVQVSRVVPGSLRVAPAGDVNQDGIVDSTDLRLQAAALGTRATGDDKPVVDWNGDGEVDVIDLAIVASNMGKKL